MILLLLPGIIQADNSSLASNTSCSSWLENKVNQILQTQHSNLNQVASLEQKMEQMLRSYLDQCSSSPCLQGGTCTNGVNDYKCDCTSEYYGRNCQYKFTTCYDAYNVQMSGIFTLHIDSQTQVRANCLPGGWTVIQSRGQFGNPDDYFLRDWDEYVQGFGTPGENVF